MTTTLLMTFCCCEWFCRRETTSRQRTSFCLKVKQKFSMRTETSTARGAAMMHSTFNSAKSVSLPGSCSVWLFSSVPNKVTQLPSFFFLDLKRTIGQSMEEKQIKGKVTRGHIFLRNIWAKLRISARSDLWLWVIWIIQTVLPWEPRKPNLSTTAPVPPKTRSCEQRPCVFHLLKTQTSGGSNACLVVTGADKRCSCISEPWTRRTVMILFVGATDLTQQRPGTSVHLA